MSASPRDWRSWRSRRLRFLLPRAVGEAGIAEPGADRQHAPVPYLLHEGQGAQALHHGVIVHQHHRIVVGDGRDLVAYERRQVEILGIPVAGKVLRSAVDRTVRVDFSRTADADEGREPEPFLLGARDQLAQHGAQAVDRFLARHLVFVGVAPQLETPYCGFCQLRRLLETELDHAGADVGPADIDGQNGVVALEQPRWRQMCGADQAGLVRVEADGLQVNVDVVGLENDAGARNRPLADAAGAKAAAHLDALGAGPRLELEEAADDQGQILGKILDRAVQHGGPIGIAFRQQDIELLFADVLGRLVAERIFSGLAQRLAPFLENFAEGPLAGAVAEKAVLVLHLDVVAVDLDRRQAVGAVRHQGFGRGIRHDDLVPLVSREPSSTGAAGESFIAMSAVLAAARRAA